MQDAKDARAKLIAKIQALRAKTESSGATEQEAMSAAQKADDLMTAYEVLESELAAFERREPSFNVGNETLHTKGSRKPRVWLVSYLLGKLTRCRIIARSHMSYSKSNSFEVIGDAPDRELCKFLFLMIQDAMDRDYRNWQSQQPFGTGQGAKASFQMGMAQRLNDRIRKIIAERHTPAIGGNALVVVQQAKNLAINKATAELFPKLRHRTSSTRTVSNRSAFGAGQNAGDRIGLGRPLGAGESRARLA